VTHAQAPQPFSRFSRCPRAALLGAILFLSFFPSAFPEEQTSPASRPAAVLDSMPHFKRISEFALSPDGARVAYIANFANQKRIVAPVDSGHAKQSKQVPTYLSDGSWMEFFAYHRLLRTDYPHLDITSSVILTRPLATVVQRFGRTKGVSD
jgi:hypothetical protein